MTTQDARTILKKHAAIYGDARYEPAAWVIDAMKEAAKVGTKARRDRRDACPFPNPKLIR